MKEKKQTNWIWIDSWHAEDKEEPGLALFRKKFEIAEAPKTARIRISADSRYKLFVNGILAEAGPSKGDRQVWFADEVDILPYLRRGENILAVQVLRYPLEHAKGNHGIFRTEFPGLYVEGEIQSSRNTDSLNGDESWKCRKDRMFHIVSESEIFAPLQIYEDTKGDEALKGWMQAGYDDTLWETAFLYQDMNQAVSPGNLQPRTIPYLFRQRKKFRKVTAIRQSVFQICDWEALLCDEKPLTIPPYTKEIVELTAGMETTGYLHLEVQGGKAAKTVILQAESYVQDKMRGELPVKGQREDWEHGHLDGFTDRYQAAGFGTETMPEVYEPFWFRTFRFIRLEIETEEQPLTIRRFDYTETGYPLEIKTQAETSDESLKAVWDMSERTLRLCMHETYEDCPFYEQLQYAMDSRSQILYTYAVSADDRLARKCMDDFRRSQRYDGLLNCSYPCYGPNVIPGFSIYYVLMLYDHMMYFGDKELLEDHMPAVEGILNFFHRNREKEGYVKKIGGLNGRDRFWSFIDWTPEWDETTGVPEATLQGPVTMESLLYIMGLQYAAEITEYLGWEEQAKRYRNRGKLVQQAVQRYCTGDNGMLQDGPGVECYSQHTQVFAILTDTVDIETGKKNLEQTILGKERYSQCSVAMAFYLFRALQKTGLYMWTEEYWKIWKRMLAKGAVTCVENEVGERSECHGWGALILYELPAVVLGVQPGSPGYETVRIHPEPGYLKAARGTVLTPRGMIKVKWYLEDGMKLEYEAPEHVKIVLS